MEASTTSRPLTKRSRVALACNTCRQTKSKVSKRCGYAIPADRRHIIIDTKTCSAIVLGQCADDARYTKSNASTRLDPNATNALVDMSSDARI